MNMPLRVPIEIADIILKNQSKISDFGLMHGRMGIALFFYHLANCSNNTTYSEFASELLDQTFGSLHALMKVDFTNGLTGIGWGIEYLIQHQFVEADSDEVLETMDKIVAEALKYRCDTITIAKSIGYYYIARLIYRTQDRKSEYLLNLKYHVILLIDELERQMTNCLLDSELAYLLDELHKLSVYNYKVNKLRQRMEKHNAYQYFIPEISVMNIASLQVYEQSQIDWNIYIENIPLNEQWGLKNGIAGIGLQLLIK